MFRILSKNRFFIASLVLLVFICILYIYSATVNTVMIATIPDVLLIDKFHQGTLTFQDLWVPFGEHRLLGFRLLFLFGSLFLGLNSFYALYLVIGTFVLSSLILYILYKRSLPSSDIKKIQLNFLPVLLIIFALTQMPGLTIAGMTDQFMISIVLALIGFALTDSLFRKFSFLKLGILIFIIFSLTLLFGGGYSAGFYFSIVIVIIIRSITERTFELKIVLPIIFSLLAAYIFYSLPAGSLRGNGSDSNAILEVIKGNGLQSLSYFIKLTAASLMGQSANGYAILKTLTPYFATGTILMLFYIYSIKTFFTSKMRRKTFMPLFLMAYAFGTMIAVWLGRSHLPENALNPWYIPFTKFAAIGVLWILFYNYAKKSTLKNKIVYGLAVFFIVFVQLFGYYAEIQSIPHRRYFMEYPRNLVLAGKENIVASIGSGEVRYTPFYSDFENTMNALNVLEKYNLSFYRNLEKVSDQSVFQNVTLISGWYDSQTRSDGALYRWINKTAIADVQSGEEGMLIIEGFVPPFNRDIEIKIVVNNQVLFTEIRPEGPFKIEQSIAKNSLLDIQIQTDKSTVLEKTGLGKDARDLSIIIYDLSAR